MKSYLSYSMTAQSILIENKKKELFKNLREWAKAENYSEEMTEKVIDSLRLMMSGIKF